MNMVHFTIVKNPFSKKKKKINYEPTIRSYMRLKNNSGIIG